MKKGRRKRWREEKYLKIEIMEKKKEGKGKRKKKNDQSKIK